MRLHRIGPWVAVALIGAACDIPTDPPIIEQRWVLPLEVVTLGQAELLPIDVTEVGGVYEVNVADVSVSESLGNLCAACAALNGLTVPTPPFSGSFTSVDNLPSDVLAVEVVGGSVDLTITNGLSFDPIAGGGSLTLTVAEAGGGDVLGSLVLDGATDTMAPGSVTNVTLAIGSGTVSGGIETRIQVVHTGGQNTTIDTSEQISLSAVTNSFQVSEATVDVDGLTATLSEEPIDVDDLEDSVVDAIQSGSASMTVTNPFNVVFDGSITVGGITKSISVAQDESSTVEIAFTGPELQAILGTPGATFSGSGTLTGGPATVMPGLELAIEPKIDLILEIGG